MHGSMAELEDQLLDASELSPAADTAQAHGTPAPVPVAPESLPSGNDGVVVVDAPAP